MNYLVVDNGNHLASMLGQALRDVGQKTLVSQGPAHAINLVRHLPIDAVIVDLEMPSMTGIQFVESLPLNRDIPIAFRRCTRDRALIGRALEIGILFPERWNRADVGRLVASIRRRRRRRRPAGTAQSAIPESIPESIPELAPVAVADQAQLGEQPQNQERAVPRSTLSGQRTQSAKTKTNTWLLVPMNKIVRKIRVNCHSWEQITKLCDQQAAGKNYLTLRGYHQLQSRDRLTVTLELPDGLMISIAAQVTSVRREHDDSVYVIHLAGLTSALCARLRAMVPGSAAPERAPEQDQRPAAGAPPDRRPSIPIPSWPMRNQIEQLAAKMQPLPSGPLALDLGPDTGPISRAESDRDQSSNALRKP